VIPHAPGKDAVAAGLELRGISKAFGATVALDRVDVDVQPGEVLALLGQNGAGKSTLIKVLAGVYRPDAGDIRLGGAAYDPLAPDGRVSFIHQDLGLVEWMTVAENMALARGFARRRGLIDWRAAEQRARDALALIAPDIDPLDRIQHLGRTERSLVAIARALDARARVIVLDEPTASLPQFEVERLFVVLRQLRARGIALMYVSHRLDEIFALSDRIVVLRDGRLVHACATAQADAAEVVRHIVGAAMPAASAPGDRSAGARVVESSASASSVAEASPASPVSPGSTTSRPTSAPLLSLRDVRIGDVGPLALEVHAGEVVGLVGLRGAGQEEVGRALIGAVALDAGQVLLDGRAPDLRHPASAVAAGIGFVPGDRLGESIAPTLAVRENLFVNPPATGRGLLALRSHADEAREATELGARVHLRPNNAELPIENLSGGNQQKVVIARWLRIGGRLLVLEEPTAGVDVGARAEIYRLLDDMLASGRAVLLVSTDLEEVARICRRALVFRRGRIVAELRSDDLTPQRLLRQCSLGDETVARAA
jgi:ribose transport system ATP-binding protein